MDYKNIIKSRKGRLLDDDDDDDILKKRMIKCINGHLFEKYINDIKLGEWCDLCDYKIENILVKLGIEYVTEKKLDDYIYDLYIPKYNFLILMTKILRKDKVDYAILKNYNVIVVDYFPDNLDKLIWEAIKSNKKLTTIKKVNIKEKYICDIIEVLKSEKDESGSIIKKCQVMEPDKPIAVGYVRVSTAMQVQDGFSLESQEQKIYNEISKRDLAIKSIYIDKGISGGSMNKRLGLEHLIESLSKDMWVIVNSVSRLARNTKDLLSLVELFEKNKCHLVIIDLNLDITSPSGKLILTLLASQAQFEREITSERVKGVMTHLKDIGALRTKPPFGWMMNPDKSKSAEIHIRNEDEQKIIDKLRELRSFNRDMSYTGFSEYLNNKNIPPPRSSKKWYHKSLKIIMEREGIK